MDTAIARARALYLAGDVPAVDAVPCVCGGARADHSGATHAGACPATGCARYRSDPIVMLAARAAQGQARTFREDLAAYDRHSRAQTKKKAPGVVSVRPSDLGACRRSVWYRETPPEGYVPAPSERGPAWMGGIIHDEVMRRRSVLYPWRLYGDRKGFEVYLPGNERPSKYDEYDPITGVLTSWKTAGEWQWNQVGERGADDKWIEQDQLYAMCLRALDYPVDVITVEVVKRDDAKNESFSFPYSEEAALAALAKLQALATMIELGVEQPRDRSGPSTDGICRNCPARRHCWNMDEAEALGKSPENLTILGLDPEDAVVEELGLALIDARAKGRAAKNVEDELKALLDGVELRPYGEVEAVPGYSSNKAYGEWATQVDSLWNLPDAMRPAELPPIRVNNTRYVTWKKLRKATRDRLAKEQKARELEAAQAAEAPLTVASERVPTSTPLALEAGPVAEAS